MSTRISEKKQDPATYRLIELLFGKVTANSGNVKEFQTPWMVFVYIAGPNLCTASPNDHQPSNDQIITEFAEYAGNGVVKGQIHLGMPFTMTEAGLLLMFNDGGYMNPDTTVLITKTCFDRAINLSEDHIVDIEIKFVM